MNLESGLFDIAMGSLLISGMVTAGSIVMNKRRAKSSGASTKTRTPADKTAYGISIASLFIITAFIVARMIRTSHGPFTNMYEFSVAFTWGILVMSLYFSWKYRNMVLSLLGTLLGAGLWGFASLLSAEAEPLVPALQNSLLLSAHVLSAVIAYGSFTIGLISSVLFLIQKKDRYVSLPNSKTLENISYHSVVIGFPFMTLVIVLGSIWADIAWGRFWSWDPKETASLITWLLYAGYLHTRIVGKWQGRKSAILLIIGFVSVVFTFFGNYIFNGLHSYG